MTYKIENNVLKKELPAQTLGSIEDVAVLIYKKERELTKKNAQKARIETELSQVNSEVQAIEDEIESLKKEGAKLSLDNKKEYDSVQKSLLVEKGLKSADDFPGDEWLKSETERRLQLQK